MKFLGKFIANKLLTIAIVLVLVGGLFFAFRNSIMNMFKGTSNAEYEFVIERFSRQTKLVVADADVKTTRNQKFENDNLKDWPDWTKPITKVFVGRNLVVDVPVKTEFKIDLNNVTSSNINIENNELTFNKKLVIEVDSQQEGDITISKQSNGVVDKVVDAFTSGTKAQEFLSEKTKETVYKTSEYVLDEKKKNVIEHAEESLEQVINLDSERNIDVVLNEDDIEFKIVDKE
ncbi:hypothetical protein [Streptococcus pacificus]|uniref:DUF4230 domain-containing protein n=1 Tax=Streptococcus pacificus TaxID=2740577 RepID=A0ABS0ZGI8_9STRE|nr:hypothetical protein [Streptococcus pacificus]MBJ8325112.1 hypothetical protein [Streptococcus pacificus]